MSYGIHRLPTSYAQAAHILGPEGARRKVANNTDLYRRADGGLAVRHHRTDIVVFRKNGAIEVDDGDYASQSTMQRIGRCLSGRQDCWAFSEKGVAYGRYVFDYEGDKDEIQEPLPVVFPPIYTEVHMGCDKLQNDAAWQLLESAGVVEPAGEGYGTQDEQYTIFAFRRIGRPVRGRPLYVVKKRRISTDGTPDWNREVFRTGDVRQLVHFIGNNVGPRTASSPAA
jgi:hypothetical protein